MAQPVLEVKQLQTYFFSAQGTRVVKAVDGVSFTLNEGETLGVVGESGSGKTVTSMSLLRLLPPAARIVGGEVWFQGENLLTKSEREMRELRGSQLTMILQDQMSGGMRQRIVGAIGISCEPKLLIADEPTTSLDVTIQAQYLNLLKDIQQRS